LLRMEDIEDKSSGNEAALFEPTDTHRSCGRKAFTQQTMAKRPKKRRCRNRAWTECTTIVEEDGVSK
jgi:hypothetical protein